MGSDGIKWVGRMGWEDGMGAWDWRMGWRDGDGKMGCSLLAKGDAGIQAGLQRANNDIS